MTRLQSRRRFLAAVTSTAALAGCLGASATPKQSTTHMTTETDTAGDDGFDHDVGEWFYDLQAEDAPDEERYWQVLTRYWNPDAFREEYRIRRPLEGASADDMMQTPSGREHWEFRMVTGTWLATGYSALSIRNPERGTELTEKYGDASEVAFL